LGQKAQLEQRILQLQEEIFGLAGRSASKRREIEFVNQGTCWFARSLEKKLVPINRVMTLERAGLM